MKIRAGPAKITDADSVEGAERAWSPEQAVARDAGEDNQDSDLDSPDKGDTVVEATLLESDLPAANGDREELIRDIAYQRYHLRDYVHGYALDDWLAAEEEVDLRFTPEA